MENGKTALITGASSGIGWSTALELSQNGYQLILCGRRKERLNELRNSLPDPTPSLICTFDVRNRKEVEEAMASLPESFRPIDLLINNAGNAFGKEPIQEGAPEDWDKTLQTNVNGLLYVTHAVLPLMQSSKKKQIINVGSIAGKEAYPGGNVYCASKAAIDSLTKSMSQDLLSEGFNVGQIAPGAVETEFSDVRFKGDKEKAQQVYEGFEPLTAKDIAESIVFMANRPHHVSISDLTIYPRAQANAVLFERK